MTPSVIDDGTKAGWGLVAFIAAVWWAFVAFTLALAVSLWERRREA